MRRISAVSATTALLTSLTLALASCGSSSSSSTSSSGAAKGSTAAFTISGSGKSVRYSGPKTITGGLVHMSLHNAGQIPHGAQLIRVLPPHTVAEALKVVGGNSNKTPDWIRGEGGVGQLAPGTTATAVLNLPAGTYGVADVGGPGSSGPPAFANLTVSSGSKGTLPTTATTVTAATAGKDKYKWQIHGALAAGHNTLTFHSEGANAIHLIAAARITGKHSKADLVKALSTNGPPPSYVEQQSLAQTAVLDGNTSQVTSLTLSKPGTYVLFCPLTDRDGGKPHLAEGLLTTVTVK